MPVKKKDQSPIQKLQNSAKLLFHRPKALTLIIILIIIGLLYLFRGLFIVAMVNGTPISRISIIQSLEKQYGKSALESQVTKVLILQEAKKQKIEISQSEIDTDIKTIEKNLESQGQSLDQVLAVQGMSRQDLIEQSKIQKIVEKILRKDVTVGDKEIDDYITASKQTAPEGTSEEQFKAGIKQQLEQQKMSEKFQTWIAGVQKSAKINYYVNY